MKVGWRPMDSTGGSAFPVVRMPVGDTEVYSTAGMTLRDYFAAAALPEVIRVYSQYNNCGIGVEHLPRNCAAHAYAIAEEMIEQKRLRETRP